MMIATSIEQSRILIDAGVSIDTADLYYVGQQRFDGNDLELTGRNFLLLRSEHHDHFAYMQKTFGVSMDEEEGVYFLPAWSLSALWDYIHNLDKTYDFPTTMSADELIETLVNTIVYRMRH